MKTIRSALASIIFTSLAASLAASSAVAAPVSIQVSGIDAAQGNLIFNIFRSAAAWKTEVPDAVTTFGNLLVPMTGVKMDLPPGDYAFFMFQDLDSNGQLKRGMFGLPGEPYAFSNNVQIHLSKPSWQVIRFQVPAQGAKIAVRLNKARLQEQ